MIRSLCAAAGHQHGEGGLGDEIPTTAGQPNRLLRSLTFRVANRNLMVFLTNHKGGGNTSLHRVDCLREAMLRKFQKTLTQVLVSAALLAACGGEGSTQFGARRINCTPETLRAKSLEGHLPGVRDCLTIDVDANSPNQDGLTPLMLASANGHTDVVLALLEGGADVNAGTSQGQSALMFAAHWGRLTTAQALVEHGAVVTQQDEGDRTATDWAAMSNAPESERIATARYLQAMGAPLRQRSGLDLFLSVGGAPNLAEMIATEASAGAGSSTLGPATAQPSKREGQ